MWLLLLSCIGGAFKSISMLGLMVEEWSILQHLRPHEGASIIPQEHGCNSFSRRRELAGPLLQMKTLSNPGMAACLIFANSLRSQVPYIRQPSFNEMDGLLLTVLFMTKNAGSIA